MPEVADGEMTVASAGMSPIYLQINTGGATRENMLQMIPETRSAFDELDGQLIRIYGPDGDKWWGGTFRGLH